MEYTLKNGAKISGTPTEVVDILTKLGEDVPVYVSRSRGTMPIPAMDTEHIKNALFAKINTTGMVRAFREIDPHVLLRFFTVFTFVTDDVEFKNLVAEYIKRVSK